MRIKFYIDCFCAGVSVLVLCLASLAFIYGGVVTVKYVYYGIEADNFLEIMTAILFSALVSSIIVIAIIFPMLARGGVVLQNMVIGLIGHLKCKGGSDEG